MSEPVVDTGMITHMCPCGSECFKILATFEDYEIASYSTDMFCAECGMKHRVPTPIDRPDMND